jgi:MFS family permease
MAYTLLDAVFAGILGNAPLMAVKAMGATDVQLELPLAMASLGLFGAVFSGAAMAGRRKKPFVVVPGVAGAIAAFLMAWMNSAQWFLAISGVISICDFAMRPAVPSIVRVIYPPHCRAHVSGTLRQYSSIAFLAATLLSASSLSVAGQHVRSLIHLQLALAGLASLAAYACFQQLPDRGDGDPDEAAPETSPEEDHKYPSLTPLYDRRFRRYLACFFVYGFSNLFHSGIVPAFFARDLGLGYLQATLLLHIIPNVTAFLAGGRLTAWFDRTTIWRGYSFVALMWGLDPVLLAALPSFWPTVIAARVMRGPATLGSMVLCFFTGVHSFARPGRNTSRYMSALFLVNGVARLAAPTCAAIMLGYWSRRSILLAGGIGVLVASAMFLWNDRWDGRQISKQWRVRPHAGDLLPESEPRFSAPVADSGGLDRT